ncbi:MAG TPA: DUF4384 domain-containing protein [Gemmatimonadales bacterium]
MHVVLGWMLLTGLPFPATSPIESIAQAAPAPRGPGARVAVWADREEPYRRGEGARVYIATEEPSHLAVFRIDTDGRIRVLFPREPWGETFVRDARTLEVSGARGGRSFMVDDYPGVGYLLAVASPQPFDFDDISRGDYWDYRLIDDGRLRGDPYVLLADLAGRIAHGADYEYDITPYYVERRYEYPRFVCYDCHAYASYDEWDPYERACSRFRIVIYDDPSRYPYRYGRGRQVVTPAREIGPRYLFRDADPRRNYVTRVPRAPVEDLSDAGDRGRTSEDVGGPGAVPAPAAQSPDHPRADRARPEAGAAVPRAGERRGARGTDSREPRTGQVPEGLRPAEGERRLGPGQRSGRPPQSTGEPELRRRRP